MKLFVRCFSTCQPKQCSALTAPFLSTRPSFHTYNHIRPSLLTSTNRHIRTFTMQPPSKRKAPGRRHHYRPKPNPTTSPADQPRRPTPDEVDMPVKQEVMDVKRLYSSQSGDQAPVAFASLGGTLHKTLLDGLDKMGFE